MLFQNKCLTLRKTREKYDGPELLIRLYRHIKTRYTSSFWLSMNLNLYVPYNYMLELFVHLFHYAYDDTSKYYTL